MQWVVFLFNKKSQMGGKELAQLIFAIETLIFLVYWMTDLGEFIKTSSENEICRTSAALKTKTKGPLGTESPLGLHCKINDFKSDALSKEEVKFEIAQEMYSCWYQYGEGNLDFYGSWDMGSSDTHCLICSRIGFDDDVEELTFGEFGSYLNTPLPGKDETFAEYFTQTPNAKIQIGPKPGEGTSSASVMDLDKGVYVVFRVNKYNEDNQAIASLFTGEEEDLSYTTTGVVGAGGIAAQGARSYAFGGEVVGGFTDSTGKVFYSHVDDAGKYFMRDAAGKTVAGFGSTKFNSLAELTTVATSKNLKFVSKSAARTLLRKTANFGEKAAIGVASKVVGKRTAGKLIPYVGWALAVYDAASAVAWADELHPSVVIYGVNDISEACDTLA